MREKATRRSQPCVRRRFDCVSNQAPPRPGQPGGRPQRRKIPVVAVLDSNSDPTGVTYPVPGNDDAIRAITLYCDLIVARSRTQAIRQAAGEPDQHGGNRNWRAAWTVPQSAHRPARNFGRLGPVEAATAQRLRRSDQMDVHHRASAQKARPDLPQDRQRVVITVQRYQSTCPVWSSATRYSPPSARRATRLPNV
jgi:hypothetical protein